ncbi:MAG: hypothetical protein ACT4QF_05095 [Sporichthyaceae bacterium]
MLAALLAAHATSLPARVTTSISEAADELLDPLVLPDYIPVGELPAGDPKAVLDATIDALRGTIPHADATTALACGRALRVLHVAAEAWPSS